MGLGQSSSIALVGLQGYQVAIESHLTSALPNFTIVGLPDASLNEARDRVRAAIATTGFDFPARKVTINLAPASLPKSGPSFDVAIALAVLDSAGVLPNRVDAATVFLGELGLDGRVHEVLGVLPAVAAARATGFKRAVVPVGNRREAELIGDIEVIGIEHLAQAAALCGAEVPVPQLMSRSGARTTPGSTLPAASGDMREVLGQQTAKFALELAAAGGHNVFMVGPPGTGKTMLASRLPTILPELTSSEALEVASIHSVGGLFDPAGGLSTTPPFESPHHTATGAAIIGGGSGRVKPGAISRAHRGVLFLDEAPEFSARVLQTLRQPLESGAVAISRASGTATFPARFQLVAAANPCPCGNAHGDGRNCVCTALHKRRYMQRLSGPLMDRIDIQIQVLQLVPGAASTRESESSAVIRARVQAARAAAAHRLRDTGWNTNREVPGSWIRGVLGSHNPCLTFVNKAVEKGTLTMRGADRVLRVAWTLADLSGRTTPTVDDVHQALTMRVLSGVSL
ncbi:YifB family Mg chelatase-like AAA ATPase [Populibacterium corticicola]|uniref:YifB family Mg chelatase-like AAA ATPase n=1 Tax=Populibacterium corticicola TaxID=1812826 RepID=A0ABW5XGM3_9MICO